MMPSKWTILLFIYCLCSALALLCSFRSPFPPDGSDLVSKASATSGGGKSRLRVAQCFVGETRTFGHPLISQNYHAHVSSIIGADIDAYFVLDDLTNATTAMSNFPVPVVAADTVFTPSFRFQYLRWFRCLNMIEAHENTTGVVYSHVIMSRVDLVILQDIPRVEDFPVASVWLRPYPENMDDYPPVYSVGDNGAKLVDPTPPGVCDLILVMSRQVAGQFLPEMQSVFYDFINPADRHPNTVPCGKNGTAAEVCGISNNQIPECIPKCALYSAQIPFVFQNFQVRILRDHERGHCKYFFPGDWGKHANSMCI